MKYFALGILSSMEAGTLYKHILLKLSGEVLAGDKHTGLDFKSVREFASDLAELKRAGIELSIVIGGGNMIRGRDALNYGLEHVQVDAIGMLGTVMNALALKFSLLSLGVKAEVLSAVGMTPIAELYTRENAKRLLSSGHVVIFGAGTGHPFFSTDTAAALRASELGVGCLVKATKVNGIYTKDPEKFPDAEFLPELTYSEAIARNIAVMDTAAFALCRENKIPVWVMSIHDSDWVKNITEGRKTGTIVKED